MSRTKSQSAVPGVSPDTSYPRPKDPGYAKNYLMEYPNLPVIGMSYDDAIAFCA
jgi:hypothetical protein